MGKTTAQCRGRGYYILPKAEGLDLKLETWFKINQYQRPKEKEKEEEGIKNNNNKLVEVNMTKFKRSSKLKLIYIYIEVQITEPIIYNNYNIKLIIYLYI